MTKNIGKSIKTRLLNLAKEEKQRKFSPQFEQDRRIQVIDRRDKRDCGQAQAVWRQRGWDEIWADGITIELTRRPAKKPCHACHAVTLPVLCDATPEEQPLIVIATTFWTCFTSAVCRQMGGGQRMKSVSRGNFARQLGNKFSSVGKRLRWGEAWQRDKRDKVFSRVSLCEFYLLYLLLFYIYNILYI